jgi:para-aminobenzoate synthetase
MTRAQSRVLLIDSYDSFTFNLTHLVEKVTGAEVITIHNDTVTPQELIGCLRAFDAVIVGPGPGTVENPADVGVLPTLWSLPDDALLPVFGVCLGFQSLVFSHGGSIHRLPAAIHGQPGAIEHRQESIFRNIPQDFHSIRYHSLHARLSPDRNDIEGLAWCHDGGERVLMAGRHVTKPFYGVQYHPESVCSECGADVLANFWTDALVWSKNNRRPPGSETPVGDIFSSIASRNIKPLPLLPSSNADFDSKERDVLEFAVVSTEPVCEEAICEQVGIDRFVLLNSAKAPGRWTIIGELEQGKTVTITHYADYRPDTVFVGRWGQSVASKEVHVGGDGVWRYLADHMGPKLDKFANAKVPTDAPFVGGLVGYISYEEGIDWRQPPQKNEKTYPDTNLVDIEHVILIDKENNITYALTTSNDDWIQRAKRLVASSKTASSVSDIDKPVSITIPDKSNYVAKIAQAQEFLKSGDSYELCLTSQARIEYGEGTAPNPWQLYKILKKRNPAPYSVFLDLVDATLVGSSPERFMSWRRDGVCEFRPIKGTVKRTPDMTRSRAEKILQTPKERGENLMIVDLIRHDLGQILNGVRAAKLMSVEEYETVYQLVSVIQGDLPSEYRGIDVLAHSLPPGSMTGAPKRRSVDILNGLEEGALRGIYSGVAGYWSLHDEGDWSVVIRSAFQYKSDPNVWRIGAGGAITILSDPTDEFDEMETKLSSALQAFVN